MALTREKKEKIVTEIKDIALTASSLVISDSRGLKVSEISNCPVLISGGVSSIEDIKKAKTLKNIEGVIVG